MESSSFSEFEQALPKLKDIHSKYQTEIVSDLDKISKETEKIIGSLSDIEKQITEYQGDIDEWANRINTLTTEAESINAVFPGFEVKILNCEKIAKELKHRAKKL